MGKKIHFENRSKCFLCLFKGSTVKFIYSEKATKLAKFFTLLLSYVVPVKSKVKISQNFVAEYMNFSRYFHWNFWKHFFLSQEKSTSVCLMAQDQCIQIFLLSNFWKRSLIKKKLEKSLSLIGCKKTFLGKRLPRMILWLSTQPKIKCLIQNLVYSFQLKREILLIHFRGRVKMQVY